LSSYPFLRPGALFSSFQVPIASIKPSPSAMAYGSLALAPSSWNPMAVARYSPRESHLK